MFGNHPRSYRSEEYPKRVERAGGFNCGEDMEKLVGLIKVVLASRYSPTAAEWQPGNGSYSKQKALSVGK